MTGKEQQLDRELDRVPFRGPVSIGEQSSAREGESQEPKKAISGEMVYRNVVLIYCFS